MSFPFGNYYGNFVDTPYSGIIEDKSIPEGTVYLFNPKYKTIPVGTGEPPKFKEVIDWDATAKASAVIYNIGDAK